MSDPPPSVGHAGESDWADLATLVTSSGLPEGGLRDHLGTALIARDADRIVGSVALELYGSDALLRSLAVVPERRRTGLGWRLTEEALALARARNVTRVYLLTQTAAPFFCRLGFRAVAREDVPERVRGSLEFATLCPASAQSLFRPLPREEGTDIP